MYFRKVGVYMVGCVPRFTPWTLSEQAGARPYQVERGLRKGPGSGFMRETWYRKIAGQICRRLPWTVMIDDELGCPSSLELSAPRNCN